MSTYNNNTDGLFARLEDEPDYGNTYDDSVLNPYVNMNNYKNSQTLQDMLVAEAIQMRGVEVIYIRREMKHINLMFGEDPTSKFKEHYTVAIYIQNVEGWGGGQDYLSKFGWLIEDQLDFQVNHNLFKNQADGKLPREGDLIYFPMTNSLLELTWVEREQPFYPQGSLPILAIKAEKFNYSGEKMELEPKSTNVDDMLDVDDIFDDAEVSITASENLEYIEKINNLNDVHNSYTYEYDEQDEASAVVDEFKESEQKYPPRKVSNQEVNISNVNRNLDDLDF